LENHFIYPIEKFGAVFDAHVHTYFDFHDGNISPKDLVKWSRKWHFNWINAMAHDTLRGVGKIQREAKKYGMPVLPSMEISTGFNHILAYGVSEWGWAKDQWDPLDVIDKLRAQDAAIYLSHPAINPYSGYWTPEIVKRMDVDGIEWINGSNTVLNRITHKLFQNYPKGKIGGSDAHHPSQMGFTCTQVDINSNDVDDLVHALQKGQCYPRGGYVPIHRLGIWNAYILLKRKFFPSFYYEGHWIEPKYEPMGEFPPYHFNPERWKREILNSPILIEFD
jgi:predicted metal-dependent phosphoesterase TrpH